MKVFRHFKHAKQAYLKTKQRYISAVFQKPRVYFWFPPFILFVIIEMTAYSAQHLLGLPYEFFPYSWVILYYHLHSHVWFLAAASFVLFASTALGIYGLAAKIKYSEFLILIPAFIILAIIFSNLIWAMFTNSAMKLSPFGIFIRYQEFGRSMSFWTSLIIGIIISGIVVLYPNIRRVIYSRDIYGHSRFSTLLELYQQGMLQKNQKAFYLELLNAILDFIQMVLRTCWF